MSFSLEPQAVLCDPTQTRNARIRQQSLVVELGRRLALLRDDDILVDTQGGIGVFAAGLLIAPRLWLHGFLGRLNNAGGGHHILEDVVEVIVKVVMVRAGAR